MDWYEAEVQELEQRAATPGRVVFYGSSSIRLWSTLADDLPELDPVNRGFGGSTLAACAHYFERLVVPWAPSGIVVYAGDNDLGDGQQVSAVVRSLRSLLDQRDALVTSNIPFIFLSVKPSIARWSLIDRIRSFNEHARRELSSRRGTHWVDIFHAMIEPRPHGGGRPRRELFDDDGLHLSAEGYRLWARVLRSQMLTILPSLMGDSAATESK